jgi:NAD-dependent dihydropyrimidine dehydrogenase PreA subunit
MLIPNPEKGQPPIVLYPGECWYCGCCVMECPVEGAITLRHPLMNRANWIAKEKLIKK